MVYEQFEEQRDCDYEFSACNYGSTSSGSGSGSGSPFNANRWQPFEEERLVAKRPSMASIQVPAYQQQPAFMHDQRDQSDWSSIAEATMPLKTSELLRAANNKRPGGAGPNFPSSTSHLFLESIEYRSREISRKLVWVNLISLLINLSLALVAFYFSFVNNSSSTSAFAADCVLDFISSAIVLWRYYGDLSSVLMQAREQIACIYLGALFELSALGIIIKAASDIASGSSPEHGAAGYDLIYLSIAATVACTVLAVFKCSLYHTIRDKSILLDVINTAISTVFAMSIIMSQLLINVDSSLWYMDPILSIVLAVFMAGFGLKVISQNINILRPNGQGVLHAASTLAPWSLQKACPKSPQGPWTRATNNNNYENNLQISIDQSRAATNWQKSDYSTIAFV